MYSGSENHVLLDAVAFHNDDSTHDWSRANALFVLKVGGREEAYVNVERSENKSSEDIAEKSTELSDLKMRTKSILCED